MTIKSDEHNKLDWISVLDEVDVDVDVDVEDAERVPLIFLTAKPSKSDWNKGQKIMLQNVTFIYQNWFKSMKVNCLKVNCCDNLLSSKKLTTTTFKI